MIIIRVDASANIGLGHLMRCLALAEGFRRKNVGVVFITRSYDQRYVNLIEDAGFKAYTIPAGMSIEEELEKVNDLTWRIDPIAIILDGYSFDGEYQKQIDCRNALLVYIGGQLAVSAYADIIISPQPSEVSINNESKSPAGTKLLGGYNYLLLREPVIEKGYNNFVRKNCNEILLTFGGGQSSSFVYKIYKCIKDLPFNYHIIINSESKELEHFEGKANVKVYHDIYDLSELMKIADLTICASGSTCWELCYMGVPFINYILAKNQEPNALLFERLGVSINMGWDYLFDGDMLRKTVIALANNYKIRKQMSGRGKSLVDGQGVERVVTEIIKSSGYE